MAPKTVNWPFRLSILFAASLLLSGSGVQNGILTVIQSTAANLNATVAQPTASNLNATVTLANTSQVDAFQRLRSSTPTNLFDSQFQYNAQPFLWESILTGTGTATQLPAESGIRLRVAANGDSVVRQTHAYLRYQPGKSQLITMTGVMGAIKANTRQRLGYFDAANGLFWEQDGTNLRVVQRSSTSGSPVDTAVNQANWNLDKLNGTGASGITLNTATANIFVIDLQWLGAGRVRFGFDIAGTIVYCHQFTNANSLATVYMTTANLPLRYELAMTGATSQTDLLQICQSVASEGGLETERGLQFTANNGITAKAVTTRRPILSIRPKATFNSVVNRGYIQPLNATVIAATNDSLIELVYQGTLTGASFASVDANSLTEVDTSATAISGGTVLVSFYAVSGAAAQRLSESINLLNRIITLTLDNAGANPDNFSVVATSLNATSNLNATINWKEVY